MDKSDTKSEEPQTITASNADIYQMLAYCIGYGISDAILIYPERIALKRIDIRKAGVDVRIWRTGISLKGKLEQFKSAQEALGKDVCEVARHTKAAAGLQMLAQVS